MPSTIWDPTPYFGPNTGRPVPQQKVDEVAVEAILRNVMGDIQRLQKLGWTECNTSLAKARAFCAEGDLPNLALLADELAAKRKEMRADRFADIWFYFWTIVFAFAPVLYVILKP
jgi:hypothetical protein